VIVHLDMVWRGALMLTLLGTAMAYWRLQTLPLAVLLGLIVVAGIGFVIRWTQDGLRAESIYTLAGAWGVCVIGWWRGWLPGRDVKLVMALTAALPDLHFVVLLASLMLAGSILFLLVRGGRAGLRWWGAWVLITAVTRTLPAHTAIAISNRWAGGQGLGIYMACLAGAVYVLWWP
jgi:hypothetical protein